MADGSDADADAADGHANDLRCTNCGVKADALVIQRGRTEYDLASCPGCNSLVDTYIEQPTTLLLIDLLLAKHSVYRHLLYNRSAFGQTGQKLPKRKKRRFGAIRLSLAIFSVQTYLTWSKHVLQHDFPHSTIHFVLQQVLETALWHILVLTSTTFWCEMQRIHRPSLAIISQALAFSSVTKLFFMALSLVWRDVLPSDQLYLEAHLLQSAEVISKNVALSVVMSTSTAIGTVCSVFAAGIVMLASNAFSAS